MQWNDPIALIAVLVSIAAFLFNFFDKSLPKSQHDEYKEAAQREFDNLVKRVCRLESSLIHGDRSE